MNLLLAIFIVALLGAVVVVVSAPLRAARRRHDEPQATPSSPRAPGSQPDAIFERDELVAARAAKYREIRDAELDYRTGKLSREDYETIDSELRAEAVEILKRLDQMEAASGRTDDDASRRT